MKLKVYVVQREDKGLMEANPLVFLSERKALRNTRKAIERNGYKWSEEKEAWLDEEGYDISEEMKIYFHFHEAEIDDFDINVDLLWKQLKFMKASSMPQDMKDGLGEMLHVILDTFNHEGDNEDK